VGLQAQAPSAPYVALWSRIEDFHAEQLADLVQSRGVVRTTLLRSPSTPSRADRRRVPLSAGNGGWMGTVLVDGMSRATWRVVRDKASATLRFVRHVRRAGGERPDRPGGVTAEQ
jgi:hypothetical protein